MTPEEIDAKVAELSATYGKVTPITITTDDNEKITGFFKQASYDVILYVTDCVTNKEMTKGAEAMVRACLIPEASDTRILDKDNNPVIAVSFVLASMKQFKIFAADKDIKKN